MRTIELTKSDLHSGSGLGLIWVMVDRETINHLLDIAEAAERVVMCGMLDRVVANRHCDGSAESRELIEAVEGARSAGLFGEVEHE